jgi:hypothetical protein
MTIRSLAEVGIRLEKAVLGLPGDAASPEQLYERYEQIAIAILDSEHSDWPEGVLEAFLLQRLAIKRIELSLED